LPVTIAVSSIQTFPINSLDLGLFEVLPPDSTIHLVIKNAGLGKSNPGPIRVDIYTYLDGVAMDRFRGYDAFILASRISVVSQFLSSRDRDIAIMHETMIANGGFDLEFNDVFSSVDSGGPAAALLPSVVPYLTAWTGGSGIAKFDMTFSSTVYPGELMYISSVWYEFGAIDKSLVSARDTFNGADIGVGHIITDQYSLMFSLESRIDVGSVTEISVPTKIPNFSNKAVSNFMIRMYRAGSSLDESEYPFHSNDNSTTGFAVASKIEYNISTPFNPAPLSATINLTLSLNNIGNRNIFSLILISPPDYYFPQDCLVDRGVGSRIISCVPTTVFAGNRSSIKLSFNGTCEPSMLPIDGIRVQVATPYREIPESIRTAASGTWYLIGQGLEDVETAWGLVAAPFNVSQMNHFSVHYSNQLNVRTSLAITFENTRRIPIGGIIRLYYPNELTIDCTSFTKLTLPFYADNWAHICMVNTNPTGLMTTSTLKIPTRSFDIHMSHDLIPGNFSFTIDAITPATAVVDPVFSFALIGVDNNIYGSYIGYHGVPFKQNPETPILSVTTDDGDYALLWYPSLVTGGSVLGIQVNFLFHQPVAVNSNGTNPIRSFLINFPPLFENAIQIPTDFVNNNTALSLAGIDYNNTDYLLVFNDRTQKIEAGQYGFLFPVRVPYQLPPDNVWYLSICRDGGECTSLDSQGIITSMPIAGFAIGDDNVLTRVDQVKSSTAHVPVLSLIISLIGILAWF